MKERFDYQARPRLDMTFKTYITEVIFILFIYYYFLKKIKAYKKKYIFNYQDKNRGKEKG